MKKNYFIAVLALNILSSCQKSELKITEPPSTINSKSVNASREATPVVTHIAIPLDFFYPSPCNGQMIHWQGEYKAITQLVVVNNTGKVTINETTHIKGRDELGNIYVSIGKGNENYIFDFTDLDYNHVINKSRTIVTSSGDGTFLFSFMQHFTITPNGEIKAELYDISTECKPG